MRIQIIDGEIVLSEVFSGIGIQTDMGLFGIAQRDAGIEVLLNGKSVWSSHEILTQFHDIAAESLQRLRGAVMSRHDCIDHDDTSPNAVKRRSYLQQAMEGVDAARRLLHGIYCIDDPTATQWNSPYFRTKQ